MKQSRSTAVSMMDVAQQVGVSKATVSRALNGSSMISEAVRKKVIEACERLGYQINPSIQDLALKGRGGRVRSLAFVQVGYQFADPAYSTIVDGIADAAAEADFLLALARLTGRETQTYDLPRVLRDRRVDGFLASGCLTAGMVELFDQLGLPYVVLGAYSEVVVRNCLCVHPDFDALCLGLVDQLVRDGRTRISYFVEEQELNSSRRFLSTFEMTVREAGLKFHPEWVYAGTGPMCGAMGTLGPVFLAGDIPFDAIIALDYRNAIEISHLIAAREGFSTPRPRVMLATARPYSYYQLPVSAVYFDSMFDEVARVGARQLIQSINDGKPCAPGKILVKSPHQYPSHHTCYPAISSPA